MHGDTCAAENREAAPCALQHIVLPALHCNRGCAHNAFHNNKHAVLPSFALG